MVLTKFVILIRTGQKMGSLLYELKIVIFESFENAFLFVKSKIKDCLVLRLVLIYC